MHTLLAFIFTILLSDTLSSTLFLPQLWEDPKLTRRCTVTLRHKQLTTLTARTNYVYLEQLQDHSNDITVDVQALIPVTIRNSYSKISAKQVFAVEGLLYDTNLTIRGEDNSDEVRIEHNGVWFSSDKGNKDAWCSHENWNDGLESRPDLRVRLSLSAVAYEF
jgi:hypothetical protein